MTGSAYTDLPTLAALAHLVVDFTVAAVPLLLGLLA